MKIKSFQRLKVMILNKIINQKPSKENIKNSACKKSLKVKAEKR